MSSITDKPIIGLSEDLLKVQKYSEALSSFIAQSDTPITIGLQGEWGTGKTSLMSLLLEDFNKKDIASSWVNTWEYSMFKGSHETTPGVLRGMLEKLKDSCTERGVSTLKDDTKEKFGKAAKFLGNLANQVVVNKTGLDFKDAAASVSAKEENMVEIAKIKALITELIGELIEGDNPIKKVVFFVDDLDRIPPSDAVEILEALKNIFDIPNCVFVLAIDYDVVVKGLESKFGKKTEENEREFRSFFDKIIQVPFSMPTGTYDIENFLVEKLKSLGINVKDEDKELYTKAVRYSIGFNPRSLKRYLNSFSLINHLRDLDSEELDGQYDEFMLFAILGIQISYPKIFRLVTQKPNFLAWDKGFANKYGIEWDELQKNLEKFGESELIDEEWEQVVWGACQKDPYLKAKAFSLLEFLNLLRDKYQGSLEDELEQALTFAAITNVDDDLNTKQTVLKIGNKTIFNGIENKIQQLSEEGFDDIAIDNWNSLWNVLTNKAQNNPNQRVSLAKSGCGFYDDSKGGKGKNQMFYTWNPSKKYSGVKVFLKKNSGLVKSVYEELKRNYQINNEESFYINKNKDLILEPILYQELGQEKYRKLLSDLANYIH
ncbi:KAP family P-loop NTPase fold protein [Flagellimonas marinaquae]|uniref:KAP family P-loop NTPase fold protein n=1 Tax=Flagellimonas marinaquae TaxID=254955 RepID=UPI000F8D481E|nr:P-loop NTPase fold protein [Allomuricauda aquimarina]